jgi:DnaK suppressor protein
VCDCGGGNINKPRIIAIPFVSLCIKCKEAEERDEGIMINRTELNEYKVFVAIEEETSNVMDDGDIDINQFDN